MNAMIFAAGLGTRLKPLTDTMPKALVPVAERPLIEHVLLKLKASGCTHAVVNVHHFAEQIMDFLEANHNFGMRISISDERGMLLETGGGIKKAGPLFDNDDPILIHNVDILSNADLNALYQAHESHHADATLLVSERESSRYLLFDDQQKLCAWENVKTGEIRSPYPQPNLDQLNRFAFSGIHVFSPRLFKEMDRFPEKFPIIDFYLDVCKTHRLLAYRQDGLRLLDVGKTAALDQAQAFI